MGISRKEAKRRSDLRHSIELRRNVYNTPKPAEIRQVDYELKLTPLWTPEMCLRLTRVRIWLGMKLEEVAKELGMSTSTLYRLEAGHKLTCDVSLSQFKHVFGSEMNYVLKGGSGEKYGYRRRIRVSKVRPQNSDPLIIQKQIESRKRTYAKKRAFQGGN